MQGLLAELTATTPRDHKLPEVRDAASGEGIAGREWKGQVLFTELRPVPLSVTQEALDRVTLRELRGNGFAKPFRDGSEQEWQGFLRDRLLVCTHNR